MDALLNGLNAEQRAAVTLPATHALILAGAGSGKTRVLTTRIAWLVSSGQVSPQGILAVTFTNKAAKEMMLRLSSMLPMHPRGLWIGTFHGLCNRLLRAHSQDAGLPQLFQILDTADQLAAVKRVIKALNVDDEKFPPREQLYFINAQKEQGLRPGAVEAYDDFTRRRIDIYEAYQRQCEKEGAVDFAELLLRAYELLARHEPLRAHYQNRFRHLLVDEFQDTNALQYRWLKLFAGQGANPAAGSPACLFCVGDDDQSIYGFRGAQISNMRDFQYEFGVREVIRLEQNYRSQGNILDAANALIKNNDGRLGKNLWTAAGAGELLRVFEAFSDAEEARWIVDEIRSLSRDQGIARSQIALLYRANAQSRILEHALFSAGLPYRVYGGQRFFERQEIKHALAYLRLIANRDDDSSFLRVVNFPTRGIGTRTLEQLQEVAGAHGCSLHRAIAHLSGKALASLGSFAALLDDLATAASLPLPELVCHVIERSGLRTHYHNEREGQDRLDNLDELINAASAFVAEEQQAEETPAGEDAERSFGLADFLAHAALEAGEHQAGEGDEALQLMTVHAAKGLEFDVVFITGLEEGLFPHDNSISQGDIDEERRLMYVAITRARRLLFLTCAQTRMLHGQTRVNLPSRFLDEIPQALMKRLSSRPSPQTFAPTPYGDTYTSARGRSGSLYPPPAPPVRPALPPSRSSPAALAGLHIGQQVSHAKFGEGVILHAEGTGADARVQVRFTRAGTKWLSLAVARLSPL